MTTFADRLASELTEGWWVKARANQLPPAGDWSVWLLLAGRGFGKTRVLSEMANSWSASGLYKRLAIVAAREDPVSGHNPGDRIPLTGDLRVRE
jgi:phage terminase large subunit-like protein